MKPAGRRTKIILIFLMIFPGMGLPGSAAEVSSHSRVISNQDIENKVQEATRLEEKGDYPRASIEWEEIKNIAHLRSKKNIKMDQRPFLVRMKFYVSLWMMRIGKKFHTLVILIGLLGQVLFTSRFLVQWIESEKKKRSVVPVSFWYLSLLGSGLILTYGLMTSEPVLILGQFGFLIYIRNLVLIHRQKK